MKGGWKRRAEGLEVEVRALALARRDPRVPWHAKALIACTVAYAVSPIDLIPDFIPIIGHLDDALLVPLGVWLARRMIPAAVLADCRERARATVGERRGTGRRALAIVAVVVGLWLLTAAAIVWVAFYFIHRGRG